MITERTADMSTDPQYLNPNCGGHFGVAGFTALGEIAGKALGQYARAQQ